MTPTDEDFERIGLTMTDEEWAAVARDLLANRDWNTPPWQVHGDTFRRHLARFEQPEG